MNYIWGLITSLLVSIIVYLTYTSHSTAKDLADARESLANRDTILAAQNKAIDALKLDVEKYQSMRSEIKTKVEYRYRDIVTTDTTCMGQLKAIEDAVNAFYESHYKAGL